jgi:hypothetical protein
LAPELTVVPIVHNDPEGFVRAAVSVLNQTWNGSRVLKVLDDGSTDDTPLAITGVKDSYGALEVTRNEQRVGLARARNQIIRGTQSKYLAWIDPDQLWHPCKLELQFRALAEVRGHAGLAVSGCAVDPALETFPAVPRFEFTTLLAETGVYLQIGELDERLSDLMHEDFLIRLGLSSVRYAMPVSEASLVTARASKKSSARPLVPDADSVWRKHKAAIHERFGWRAAAAYRRRQLLAAAAGAASRGDRLRSIRHAAAARTIGVAIQTTWRSLAGMFAVPLRGAARASVRCALRVSAGVIVMWRGNPTGRLIVAVVNLINGPRGDRLVAWAPGLAAFTSSGSPSSADTRSPALAGVDRAALTVAYAALAAKMPERARRVLEGHITERDSNVHPRVFERLADLHAAADRLDSAEAVLTLGLRVHPSNGGLRLALADTFARMSRWDAATTCWEQISDELQATANVWTGIGIARAYRITGDPNKADAVARRAAALHPPNEQLEQEIELCRPAHLEWSRCWVNADAMARNDSAFAGTVEELGFLSGAAEPLSGRLACADTAPAKVDLYVNDLRVASTLAAADSAPPGGKVFSINCAELLQFLGDGDIVQVSSADGPTC